MKPKDQAGSRPEDSKRARRHSKSKSRSKKGKDEMTAAYIPPIHNYTMDLVCLTKQEENTLHDVIMREQTDMQMVDDKVNLIRSEIDQIRRQGGTLIWDQPAAYIRERCVRCRRRIGGWRKLVPLLDHGKRCMRCWHNVCKRCRHLQANGLYMCNLCVRYREESVLTGEWAGKTCMGLQGSDMIKVSLRDRAYYIRKKQAKAQTKPGGRRDRRDSPHHKKHRKKKRKTGHHREKRREKKVVREKKPSKGKKERKKKKKGKDKSSNADRKDENANVSNVLHSDESDNDVDEDGEERLQSANNNQDKLAMPLIFSIASTSAGANADLIRECDYKESLRRDQIVAAHFGTSGWQETRSQTRHSLRQGKKYLQALCNEVSVCSNVPLDTKGAHEALKTLETRVPVDQITPAGEIRPPQTKLSKLEKARRNLEMHRELKCGMLFVNEDRNGTPPNIVSDDGMNHNKVVTGLSDGSRRARLSREIHEDKVEWKDSAFIKISTSNKTRHEASRGHHKRRHRSQAMLPLDIMQSTGGQTRQPGGGKDLYQTAASIEQGISRHHSSHNQSSRHRSSCHRSRHHQSKDDHGNLQSPSGHAREDRPRRHSEHSRHHSHYVELEQEMKKCEQDKEEYARQSSQEEIREIRRKERTREKKSRDPESKTEERDKIKAHEGISSQHGESMENNISCEKEQLCSLGEQAGPMMENMRECATDESEPQQDTPLLHPAENGEEQEGERGKNKLASQVSARPPIPSTDDVDDMHKRVPENEGRSDDSEGLQQWNIDKLEIAAQSTSEFTVANNGDKRIKKPFEALNKNRLVNRIRYMLNAFIDMNSSAASGRRDQKSQKRRKNRNVNYQLVKPDKSQSSMDTSGQQHRPAVLRPRSGSQAQTGQTGGERLGSKSTRKRAGDKDRDRDKIRERDKHKETDRDERSGRQRRRRSSSTQEDGRPRHFELASTLGLMHAHLTQGKGQLKQTESKESQTVKKNRKKCTCWLCPYCKFTVESGREF